MPIQVNPEILRWARKTAGLSLAEAANALGLGSKIRSGEEVLRQLEVGEKNLTDAQLKKMVKVYRRPLISFYLEKPPETASRGEDFRTLPAHLKMESSVELDALMRDIHVRQELVKSALEDADEAKNLVYVGSLTVDYPVHEAAKAVHKKIGFSREKFLASKSAEDAFSYIRQCIEGTGVFVLLIGNLGSHHTKISSDVFRGFALADNIAPFIVINDQDAKSAWSFTALHELVHLWLGKTGISAGFTEQRVERYCNDVASEILLPSDEILKFPQNISITNELIRQIGSFADARKISRSLVAYRLLKIGSINEKQWQETSNYFREQWIRQQQLQKNNNKNSTSGPDYYVVKRHRIGGALINLVRRNIAEGYLTPTRASRVLGVKPGNVASLLDI